MTRHIAMLIGSLRRDSYTRKIARKLVELAPPGLRFDEVPIGDLPLYNQDLDGAPPSEWIRFRDRVRAADGVLFATPEYNRSIPGGLKNALDVGSRPYGKSVWKGKPSAVISVSPGRVGGFGANHHLRQCCVHLDIPCLPHPEAYVGGAAALFDSSGALTDDDARKLLIKFVTAFANWIDRLAAAPPEHARRSA